MKRSTIYDIAEKAGVSVTTVTRAFKKDSSIKPKTRERILKLAEEFNYTPSINAIRLSRKAIVIGAILDTCSEELYKELKKGLEAAHKELAGFKVELEIRSLPKDIDGTDLCEKFLEELLDSGIHGLILALQAYSESFIRKLNDAVNEGLNLVLLINDCDVIRQSFHIRTQSMLSGRVAAELLRNSISGNEVAVFLGNRNVPVHKEAIAGFEQEARALGLVVAEVCDFKENLELSRKQVKEVVGKHPGLGGIFVSSANSDAIVDELVKSGLAGGRIKIVTTDLYPRIADHIESGAILATIYKNPYQQAKSSFELLFKHINGTADDPDDVYVVPQVVIKGNLPAYMRERVSLLDECGERGGNN